MNTETKRKVHNAFQVIAQVLLAPEDETELTYAERGWLKQTLSNGPMALGYSQEEANLLTLPYTFIQDILRGGSDDEEDTSI